jgi:hypothetical protein
VRYLFQVLASVPLRVETEDWENRLADLLIVAGYSVQKVGEVVRLAALGRVAEVVRLAALGRVAEVVAGLDFVPVVVVSDLAESANINLGS